MILLATYMTVLYHIIRNFFLLVMDLDIFSQITKVCCGIRIQADCKPTLPYFEDIAKQLQSNQQKRKF